MVVACAVMAHYGRICHSVLYRLGALHRSDSRNGRSARVDDCVRSSRVFPPVFRATRDVTGCSAPIQRGSIWAEVYVVIVSVLCGQRQKHARAHVFAMRVHVLNPSVASTALTRGAKESKRERVLSCWWALQTAAFFLQPRTRTKVFYTATGSFVLLRAAAVFCSAEPT